MTSLWPGKRATEEQLCQALSPLGTTGIASFFSKGIEGINSSAFMDHVCLCHVLFFLTLQQYKTSLSSKPSQKQAKDHIRPTGHSLLTLDIKLKSQSNSINKRKGPVLYTYVGKQRLPYILNRKIFILKTIQIVKKVCYINKHHRKIKII